MRTLIVWLGGVCLSHAQSISLQEILDRVDRTHPLVQQYTMQRQGLEEQRHALGAREPMRLHLAGSRGEPEQGRAGSEYGIGVEQTLMWPGVKADSMRSLELQHAQIAMEQRLALLRYRHQIRGAYHGACLEVARFDAFQRSMHQFDILLQKQTKAYELGALSKPEVLQLEMEQRRMQRQLTHYQGAMERAIYELAGMAASPELASMTLACHDLAGIDTTLSEVKEGVFTLSRGGMEQGIAAWEALAQRHDHWVESYDLALQYESELDTQRYTIGVTIPLGFTSEMQEANRASAQAQKAAAIYEKQRKEISQESKAHALKVALLQSVASLTLAEDTLVTYEETLMPMLLEGYRLGAHSAVAYLFGVRDLWQWQSDVIDRKQHYYTTLFELYSTLEIEEE